MRATLGKRLPLNLVYVGNYYWIIRHNDKRAKKPIDPACYGRLVKVTKVGKLSCRVRTLKTCCRNRKVQIIVFCDFDFYSASKSDIEEAKSDQLESEYSRIGTIIKNF